MGAGASQADALTGDARAAELRRRLLKLGFDTVRFAVPGELPAAGALRAWLAQGMHADMAWMERSADKRADPAGVLPGVRSVVALGVNYSPQEPPVPGPRWARYAGYEDYHDTLKPALVAAGRVLESLYGVSSEDYRYYVDAGPVLERAWLERAGTGFIGKNAMLISPEWGNWLFLAAILTRVELPADPPLRGATRSIGGLCGRCDRCQTACPTGALVRPGVIDARRCVSYLTIEHKGPIPREWRAAIGDRI
ncbi:MAG TPA: tRNA epoxyqueuosine(34) reductase QueG, partial [Opitutaceae bacterium]|nr:tRNA epoxyqueuosine(34) reductase QueG [Opitutaceae bacterium]